MYGRAMTATVARGTRGWQETVAIVLLLAGGFLWGVGWLVGVVLLWLSDVWTVREKLLGTLVVPGGLALPGAVLVFWFMGVGATCHSSGGPETCSGGPSVWETLTWLIVLVGGLVGSIATAVHLARSSRRLSV
jgi:hypothetical protein